MKLFKSKSGFTLIELLVVIGILAVLAAIAIPSVAGLIDRANVSADKTNANEMTNAIERFTSEYELYCQDIASGAVQAGNLDSAQGRVYNVLGGATTRAEITALEKPATAGSETTGRAIYRDTKYPVNVETMQAIVENYTKTSSSTFEPKQSDMHFWYSPDCGVVVYAEPDADVVEDLNSQILSGMDAKGNGLSEHTKWLDITDIDNQNAIPEEPIPSIPFGKQFRYRMDLGGGNYTDMSIIFYENGSIDYNVLECFFGEADEYSYPQPSGTYYFDGYNVYTSSNNVLYATFSSDYSYLTIGANRYDAVQ